MDPEKRNNGNLEELAKEWVEQICRVRDGRMRDSDYNHLNEVVTADNSKNSKKD